MDAIRVGHLGCRLDVLRCFPNHLQDRCLVVVDFLDCQDEDLDGLSVAVVQVSEVALADPGDESVEVALVDPDDEFALVDPGDGSVAVAVEVDAVGHLRLRGDCRYLHLRDDYRHRDYHHLPSEEQRIARVRGAQTRGRANVTSSCPRVTND